VGPRLGDGLHHGDASEAMLLEYFATVNDQRPVLLTYGTSPAEAGTLREVALRLAASGSGESAGVQIAELLGFQGIDGCSLLAEVSSVKLGVVPIDGSGLAFRCVLDTSGWQRVAGLLEPFVAARPVLNPNGFQYLDESGPIDWIISGSRGW
jgi:hypothetical protein